MRLRMKIAVAAGVLVAAGSAAYAAGLFPGFPIVGQPAYTEGLVRVPAGPVSIAAGYMIPADTRLSQGQQPQTVLLPVEQLALYDENNVGPTRNLLRNGDISVNPFQRGTAEGTALSTTGAAVYTADGITIKGGSGTQSIVASRQTGAASVVAGQFTASLRVRRFATADLTQICQAQVVTSQNSQPAVGQSVVYSFWARAGASFSPALSQITANIISGTGTDQSPTAMQAGTWAGQATPATSTLTLTTTWTQYSVAGTIASTAAQVGVDICWTPSVGAGATDFIETANHQLEVVGSANVTSPSAFEHHNAQYDLMVAQQYYVQYTESGTVGQPIGGSACYGTGLTTSICDITLPTSLRAVPGAAAVTPLTAGSFKVQFASGITSLASPTATQSGSNMMQFTTSNNGQSPSGTLSVTNVGPIQSGTVGGGVLGISAEL